MCKKVEEWVTQKTAIGNLIKHLSDSMANNKYCGYFCSTKCP